MYSLLVNPKYFKVNNKYKQLLCLYIFPFCSLKQKSDFKGCPLDKVTALLQDIASQYYTLTITMAHKGSH